jgi:hypothetical protein
MSDTTIPEGFVRIQDPSGQRPYLVLHKRDFLVGVHKLAERPAPVELSSGDAKPPAGSPGGADTTPGGIATVNSEIALGLIADVEKVEELDVLEKAEKASEKHPGGRKGVLSAIAERRKELAG